MTKYDEAVSARKAGYVAAEAARAKAVAAARKEHDMTEGATTETAETNKLYEAMCVAESDWALASDGLEVAETVRDAIGEEYSEACGVFSERERDGKKKREIFMRAQGIWEASRRRDEEGEEHDQN